MRYAELKPEFPVSIFPQRLQNQGQHHGASSTIRDDANGTKIQWKGSKELISAQRAQYDDFADDEIDDQDLIAAGKLLLPFRIFLTPFSGCNDLYEYRRFQFR